MSKLGKCCEEEQESYLYVFIDNMKLTLTLNRVEMDRYVFLAQ